MASSAKSTIVNVFEGSLVVRVCLAMAVQMPSGFSLAIALLNSLFLM